MLKMSLKTKTRIKIVMFSPIIAPLWILDLFLRPLKAAFKAYRRDFRAVSSQNINSLYYCWKLKFTEEYIQEHRQRQIDASLCQTQRGSSISAATPQKEITRLMAEQFDLEKDREIIEDIRQTVE